MTKELNRTKLYFQRISQRSTAYAVLIRSEFQAVLSAVVYRMPNRILKNIKQSQKGKRRINPKYFEPRLGDLVKKESLLLSVNVGNNQVVLDAGCGDGRISFRLVDDLGIRPSRIVMLDINSELIQQVAENIRIDDGSAPLFESVISSLFAIPCPDDTFDTVFSLGDVLSLTNAGGIEDGLRELRRVIKPGGIVLFSLVTKEYLLRIARERKVHEIEQEIKTTGVYTGWNNQFGEGMFKCWGETSQIEKKINEIGLKCTEIVQVYIDYQDIPARLLLACRKISCKQ